MWTRARPDSALEKPLVVDVAAGDELVDDVAGAFAGFAVRGQAGSEDGLDLLAGAYDEPRPRPGIDQQVERAQHRRQVIVAQRRQLLGDEMIGVDSSAGVDDRRQSTTVYSGSGGK